MRQVPQPAMSGGWSRRDAASGAEVAAGLELALLSLCDRGKVIVAVHGLLAHMLAAVEQEESERYSDYRSEESAKLPVGCPVVSHQEPPIIRTHGANACLGSRFLRRTDARGTAADLWRTDAAFNEDAREASAPSRYRIG